MEIINKANPFLRKNIVFFCNNFQQSLLVDIHSHSVLKFCFFVYMKFGLSLVGFIQFQKRFYLLPMPADDDCGMP